MAWLVDGSSLVLMWYTNVKGVCLPSAFLCTVFEVTLRLQARKVAFKLNCAMCIIWTCECCWCVNYRHMVSCVQCCNFSFFYWICVDFPHEHLAGCSSCHQRLIQLWQKVLWCWLNRLDSSVLQDFYLRSLDSWMIFKLYWGILGKTSIWAISQCWASHIMNIDPYPLIPVSCSTTLHKCTVVFRANWSTRVHLPNRQCPRVGCRRLALSARWPATVLGHVYCRVCAKYFSWQWVLAYIASFVKTWLMSCHVL